MTDNNQKKPESITGLNEFIVGLSKQLPDSTLEQALKMCSFGNRDICTEPIYYRTMTVEVGNEKLMGVFALCEKHNPGSHILVETLVESFMKENK